jgi:hypothetical protein
MNYLKIYKIKLKIMLLISLMTLNLFGEFFKLNDLTNERWKGCTFTLTGDPHNPKYTMTVYIAYLGDKKYNQWTSNYPYKSGYNFNLFDIDDKNETEKYDLINFKFKYDNNGTEYGVQAPRLQIITKLKIEKDGQEIFTAQKIGKEIVQGGRKEYVKKEILGKLRCIYKIHGSRKEHVKYKGMLITVSDYKNLMKHNR